MSLPEVGEGNQLPVSFQETGPDLSPASLEPAKGAEHLIFCSGRESRQSKHISLRKIGQKVLAGRALSRPAKQFYSVTSAGSAREQIYLLQYHWVAAAPRCVLRAPVVKNYFGQE